MPASAAEPSVPDAPSPGEKVLGELLEASHHCHPDDLADLVADAVAELGLEETGLYVVDHDQRLLLPLPSRVTATAEPLGIDSTLAGRAFRTEEPLVGSPTVVEETTGEAVPDIAPEGPRRIWMPLLDGTERIGVIGFTASEVDDLLLTRCRHVASLVAQLVVSKAVYGDGITLARRTREMALAAELRWAMLPPLTYTGPSVSIAGILEPAYEIAGDSFDYAVNGRLADVAILDAVGHGLEASRIANLAVITYRHGRRHGLGLLEMMQRMDEAVAAEFGPEKFVTGQLARLDTDTGLLSWLNAGHPAPILLRRGHRLDLEAEICMPIGLGDVPGQLCQTTLEPRDAVLFFTDGVTEARSPDGEEFGRERLGEHLIRAAAAGQTPAETMRRLVHALLEHQRGQLQDDATVLLFGWPGPREMMLRI